MLEAVLTLGQAPVVSALQQFFKCHVQLLARQLSAQTKMHALTEGQIIPGVVPTDIHFTRVFKMLVIPVGGGEAHHHHDHDAATASNGKLKVLCFSRTGWYRHPETPAINRWLVLFGDKHNMEIDVSEDGKDLRPKQLAQYDVLLLNNTNELDIVLKPEEMKSVEDVRAVPIL